MKSFAKLVAEFDAVDLKVNKRALVREKELYAFYRDHKISAIEHARRCKKLDLPEIQLRWQHLAAHYDKGAKASKVQIRVLGSRIYK